MGIEKREKIGIIDQLFIIRWNNTSNSVHYGTLNLFFTYYSNTALYLLIGSLFVSLVIKSCGDIIHHTHPGLTANKQSVFWGPSLSRLSVLSSRLLTPYWPTALFPLAAEPRRMSSPHFKSA